MKKRNIVSLLVVLFVILFFGISNVYGFNFKSQVMGIFYEGQVFFGIYSNNEIYIDQPYNTSYNFIPGENYTLNLSVYTNGNSEIVQWNYTLISLTNSQVIFENVSFSPNITIDSVLKSNKLIVYGIDSGGNVFNDSVIFYVNASNIAPIIDYIDSEIFVCEKESLSYFFNVTNLDYDYLVSSISSPNPFYVNFSELNNITSYKYELYSGVLSKDDAGGANNGSRLYPQQVSINDLEYADHYYINITVIEINNFPNISDIGVQTIWATGENSSFYYVLNVSDLEDGTNNSVFFYNVSFSGETLFNISSNGIINFSANTSMVGVHNVSVCVTDNGLTNPHENISLCSFGGSNYTSCANFSLTVTNLNRRPNITSYSPINSSLSYDSTSEINFSIIKYDSDGTIPDGYWYVDDVLEEYDSGSTYDSYTHNFGCGVSGLHIVRVVISDGELNSSHSWNITLNSIPCVEELVVTDSSSRRSSGGGGVSQSNCSEKLGCLSWSECKDLDFARDSNLINNNLSRLVLNDCLLMNISIKECGYQKRDCNVLKACDDSFNDIFLDYRGCYYSFDPSCYDDLLNCHDGDCEVLVDCGGPCSPCSTCSDGISNQGEEGIDCGGPCKKCTLEVPSGLNFKNKNLILVAIVALSTFSSIFVVLLIGRLILSLKKKKKIELEKKRKEKLKKRNFERKLKKLREMNKLD